MTARSIEEAAAFGIASVPREEAERIARTMYRYDNFAAGRVDTVEHFGPEQVRQFREFGYVVIDQLLTEAEVGKALQEVDDIIHGRLLGPKLQQVKTGKPLLTPEDMEFSIRKIYNFVDYAPALRDISRHPGMLSVMEAIFGEKPAFINEQGLIKPPYGGGEKPWHQDMAYGGLFYRKQIITVWVALDEAGLDNGCMHVIPSSHLAGGVPHYSVRDWQMCDRHVNVERDVAVPMKPGAALLFSGLLHHGTPANFSAKRRRALQFRYFPSSSSLMSKEEYRLMFSNEMTDAEC